jgi:hypothetical protein
VNSASFGAGGHRVTRSGPLNWAQEAQWVYIGYRRLDNIYPVFRNGWYVKGSVTVPEARSALRRIAQEHEILRTIFTFAADGTAIQHVVQDIEPEISEFPFELAQEHSRADGQPFTQGPPVGTPLWMAGLYTEGGIVRGVLITAEHIVFDGLGMAAWERQFHALTSGETLPLGRIRHPLDHGDVAKPRRAPADAAVELRRPQILVPGIERSEGPRYLFSRASYDGLLPAIDAICARHGCSRPTVLMFLWGLMLSRHARQDVIHLSPIICDKPANDASIECRMHSIDVELVLDSERTVSELIAAAEKSILSAYANDSRSPIDELEDAQAYAVSRGRVSRRGPVFNFLSLEATGPAPPGHGMRAGDPEAAEITDKWLEDDEPYAAAITAEVRQQQLSIEFAVDIVMHPQKVVHQMLRCLPALAHEVYAAPHRACGQISCLARIDRFNNSGLQRAGADWVSLSGLTELLAGSPGVKDAVVDIGDSGTVTARIISDGTVDGRTLHDSLAAQLWDQSEIIAPSHYEIFTDKLSGRGTEYDVMDQGTLCPPETAAERAVAAAFQEANGRAAASLGLPYFSAGGRLAGIPMFIEAVLGRGYAGLRTCHIWCPVTLRGAAASLHRAGV